MSKGRGRSSSIDPISPHHRVTSLSIARSPSILTTNSPDPLSTSSNLATTSAFLDPVGSTDFYAPTSHSHGLTRTLSHPVTASSQRHLKPRPALSDIPSDEDLPYIKGSALNEDIEWRAARERRERRESVGGAGSRDFGDGLSSLGEGDEEERESSVGYTGDFQTPDSKEMLAIMLSLGGVALLSLAAGFTTIYDWVM